jgi:cytochrome oxidase Cu insertion factor (SCO1/SenC/PrrC family)
MTLASSSRLTGARLQSVAARLVGSALFWVTLVGFIFAGPLVRAFRAKPPPPVPVIGAVPEFHLVDQGGQDFGSAQLLGKVWVFNIISTRDPASASSTEKMGKVQYRARNLGNDFALVTFSAEPDGTPSDLATFVKGYKVSPRMWHFLAGVPVDVDRAATSAVERRFGFPPDRASLTALFTGNTLILVDATLKIRGVYDASITDSMDSLMHDAGLLLNRGG